MSGLEEGAVLVFKPAVGLLDVHLHSCILPGIKYLSFTMDVPMMGGSQTLPPLESAYKSAFQG